MLSSRACAVVVGWVLALGLVSPIAGVQAESPQDIGQLKAWVRDHPQDIRSAYRLGVVYAKGGAFEEAIRVWVKIVKTPGTALNLPSRVKIVRLLGIAFFKIKRYDKARTCSKFVLRHTPQDATAHKILALTDKPPPAHTVVPAPPPPPPVSLDEAKKAFGEGERLYLQAKQALDAGNPEAETKLGRCIDLFSKAEKGFAGKDYKEKRAKALYYEGASHLCRDSDEHDDARVAMKTLEESVALEEDAQTLFELAGAYGLLWAKTSDKTLKDKEITAYEKALTIRPQWADAHFRVALAYDKSDRADASKKTLENAKLAIKLKPEYKKKFQEVLKNSEIAKKIANIVVDIIVKAESDQLTDEETEKSVKKIQEMFGEKITPEMIRDKRQLKDFMDSDQGRNIMEKAAEKTGRSKEELEQLIDKASKNKGLQKQLDRYIDKKQQGDGGTSSGQ